MRGSVPSHISRIVSVSFAAHHISNEGVTAKTCHQTYDKHSSYMLAVKETSYLIAYNSHSPKYQSQHSKINNLQFCLAQQVRHFR